MMTGVTLRRLMMSVKNPDYDGRSESGGDSIRAIEAGEFVRHWRDEEHFARGHWDVLEYRGQVLPKAFSEQVMCFSYITDPQAPVTLRRLTVDVINPSYDHRFRSGWESVKKFAAGEVVKHWTHRSNDTSPPYDLIEREGCVFSHDTAGLVVAASEVIEATTPKDVVLLNNLSERQAMDVIGKLADMGVISLQHVDAACREILADLSVTDAAIEQPARARPTDAP